MKSYFLCLVLSFWLVSSHGLPTNDTKRIIGGQTVSIENYRYYVYLRAGSSECGGTLVRLNRVITAAHCVYNIPANTIFSYTGLRSRAEIRSITPYSTRSVHIHPSYRENVFANYDIAVIKLASNVQTSSTVNTIGLATSAPPLRSIVTVVGYGNTVCNNDGTGKCRYAVSNTLQKTDLTVNQYNGHVMVTTGSNTATCNGDSGGPFTYRNQLVGVVSGGEMLCRGSNSEVSVAHNEIKNFLNQHL